MKNKTIFAFILIAVMVLGMMAAGPTRFGRLVLGEGNYDDDPVTTADLVFQNDEYIDNSTNGTLDFGAGILLTTGTISSGAVTSTGNSSYAHVNATDFIASDTTSAVTIIGTTRVVGGTGAFTTISGTNVTTTGWIRTPDSNATNPAYSFTSSTGSGMFLSASNVLGFATAGSDRVHVDAAGRLNIGISGNATAMLLVNNATSQANLLRMETSVGTLKFGVDSAGTLAQKLLLHENGFQMALHAIAAGDSVFGHTILDAADSTIKIYNGTSWVTIQDLVP